ncbi:MAG: TonB-dependent receptor [Weeksellaceae bacterium]|nr:TonB-dependent receptor [Weeksellaceae bacterium]
MKKAFLLLSIFGSMIGVSAQEAEPNLQDTLQLTPVVSMANLPITAQVVSGQEINSRNFGQDMPALLQYATGAVSTSDAGNSVGYASIRLRGIPQNQINVTFNGVPVNDSESHGVFWVNFSDLAASTERVMIQRGVGTSSNGAAAFGGSVNVETTDHKNLSFLEAMASVGSFNTQRYMLHAGSGDMLDGKLNVDARLSVINSDGYVERASSRLFSGGTNIRYRPSENTELHFMQLIGNERTYQAWYGIDGATMADNRRFNPAGAIYGADGNIIRFYENQVDNYQQIHNHLYWRQQYQNGWASTVTAHYTRGLGHYEEYTQNRLLADYKVFDQAVDRSDMIRKRWLDNHFYGAILNLNRQRIGNFDYNFGVAANQYLGGHYGTVAGIIDLPEYSSDHRYYDNLATKNEFSAFAKTLYRVNNWDFFGDLQLRNIFYKGEYEPGGESAINNFTPFSDNYLFLNPKAGINYHTNAGRVYATFGLTNREPTRADILNVDTNPTHETLYDWELGYQHRGVINFGINAYYMYYLNQLVLTGQVDDVGRMIRRNVGNSYRAGVELEASKRFINNKLNLFGNFAFSDNRNIDYIEPDANGELYNFGNTQIAYSPRIVTTFGFEYRPVTNAMIQMLNRYVAEQYVTNTGADNGRLPDYFLTDIVLNWQPRVFEKVQLEVMAMINNLWDREYVSNGYYYGETIYFPQAGRHFNVGLKVRL